MSAVRFYDDKKLLPSVRSAGGKRLFPRSAIRRVSFILISQRLGYSLEEIAGLLSTLPDQRTPNKADWQRLSRQFCVDIDDRIARLTDLKNALTGCIGCGCLSLQKCHIYNPSDSAAGQGNGPRYLMGDNPPES